MHGRDEDKLGDTQSETINPCFFYRLIIDPTEQLKKLRLPETFSGSFGNQLSDACHLKVPTDESHQVALVKENDYLWFQDGWEEFVNRYSIGYGYFIAFNYNGDSNFSVNIYDLSACQIPYDQCHKETGSPMQNGHSNNDVDNDVNLENMRSPLTNDRRTCVEVTKLNSEDDEIMSDKSDKTLVDVVIGTEGSQPGNELPPWLVKFEEELKVIAASGICIPVNPFFVAVVKPYQASCSCSGYMYFPKEFVGRHLKCKDGDYFKVVNTSQGEHWLIRFCKNKSSCSLGKGWVQFARDVCLAVGDVCLFELVDARNLVINVRVIKPS